MFNDNSGIIQFLKSFRITNLYSVRAYTRILQEGLLCKYYVTRMKAVKNMSSVIAGDNRSFSV